MNWTTVTEFVDMETGEVITQQHLEKKIFRKIKVKTNYKKQNENYGIRINTWECKRNEVIQQKLDFGNGNTGKGEKLTTRNNNVRR